MKRLVQVLTLSAFILFTACGKGDSSSNKAEEVDPLAYAGQEIDPETLKKMKEERLASLPENHLEIEGDDQMKFDLSELKAKAGKPITLTLRHVGKFPIADMGHNLVVLKLGTNIEEFAEKAIKEKDNGYVPKDDAVIVHTKLLGGGESDTITFTINEKGTYDFLCTFPAHNATMRGKLIVE